MNNKNIVYLSGTVILLIVAFSAVFFLEEKDTIYPKTEPQAVENSETEQSTSTPVNIPAKLTEGQTGDQLWAIFSRYLQAAKDHNRDELKTLSYSLSKTCEETPVTSECVQKMDAVYEAGRKLSQGNFTELWVDDRQAILATALKFFEDSNTIGFSRSIVLFAKNKDNKYGLLALDPERMWLVRKNATTSPEELQEKVKKSMIDSDKDGITDDFENCIFPDSFIFFSDCVKTNPSDRDSDGDLWWDGIDMYITTFGTV